MIRKVEELDLRDRTVFLRVDFNVPIEQGRITESHRIESALPTIRLILDRAKKIVIASHLGRPDGKVVSKYSLGPVRDHLEQSLKQPVLLAPDCVGPEVERMVQHSNQRMVLLENLRFHKEEETNDVASRRHWHRWLMSMLMTLSAQPIAHTLPSLEWRRFSSKREPACCCRRSPITSHDYSRTPKSPL